MIDNKALVNHLVQKGVLKNSRLKKAFLKIDRAFFVPGKYRAESYGDYPLPIGHGATISQPYTVAFMLELLNPKPGEKILDIGSGSGWTTALLGEVVGEKGKVFAVEIVPELIDFAQDNLKNFNINNIKFFEADDNLGLPEHAPFDKILVSASAKKMETSLIDQIKSPGKLVLPVNHSIWKIDKNKQGEISQEEYPGFVFVPLR